MKADESSATVETILQVAEDLIRKGGYHSASFRDIAARVGIKSASIHYHFPTKELLGVAVMKRYLTKTLAGLGDPDAPERSPAELLGQYVGMFRHALAGERRTCLCAMINSEAAGLPDPVREAACAFSRAHVEWLARVLTRRLDIPPDEAAAKAWFTICSLQGALATALAGAGPAVFDAVAKQLEQIWGVAAQSS